jgi:hypothetical protein
MERHELPGTGRLDIASAVASQRVVRGKIDRAVALFGVSRTGAVGSTEIRRVGAAADH